MKRHPFAPVLLSSVVAAAALACTSSDDAPATSRADRDWDCVTACLPGGPCHSFCKLSFDQPGFQIVPPPDACSGLHQLNACGDGCCDSAEATIGDEYCKADCKLAISTAPWLRMLDDGRLGVFQGDRLVATMDDSGVSIPGTCQ